MDEKNLSWSQDLTRNHRQAEVIWARVMREIENVGREDILNNPAVLDIGGGMVNFLNICISKVFIA